ncbi:MAG: pseudouridine synthase [Lysobacterales bacterium]
MLIAFNKPYGALCQFTDGEGRQTLADWVQVPGVYPAGRLDADSEGLLLLSDDGPLIARITQPRHKWPKTYVVQVEGEATDARLRALAAGPLLKDGPCLPCEVRPLEGPPDWLWPRDPPVRFRKSVPESWLQVVLREGRNRQLRRMTAAVGLPMLRLVRTAIGPHALAGLQPGESRVLDAEPAARPAPPAVRSGRTARSTAPRRR